MNDRELLQAFARQKSGSAFAELVRRHGKLVYSCARQRVGDPHAAEDITQSVFLALAIKAPKLPADVVLPGWLYRATRFAAAEYHRREQHRREREMRASEHQQIHGATDDTVALWEAIRPHLAEALDGLSSADRDAVLLRFYEQASYPQIAETLRMSHDSARKRVDRALDKLRRFFTKKGIGIGTGALAALLSAEAGAVTLPATFVSATVKGATLVAGGKLAAGVGVGMVSAHVAALTKGALKMIFIAKVKTAALIAAACVVVAGSGVVVAKQLVVSSTPVPSETKVAVPVATPVLVAPAPAPVTPDQPPTVTPAPASSKVADQSVHFTEADNGKTVTVTVGQTFEIVLRSSQKLTGWEGGRPDGENVVRLSEEKGFQYRAVKVGRCLIQLDLVYPSGPEVTTRRKAELRGRFKLTVQVRAADETSATTQPIRLANGLELVAFGPSQADAPTRTRATPLTLGVRVTNPTAQPQEFWPHKVQILLRWGRGELRTVGINVDVTARARAISIPAGGTQSFPLTDARFSYGGKPPYLAFYSASLHPGAYYEQEVKGEAGQVGFAFEYQEDNASPRTVEIICRLVAAPAAAAPAVNEYVAQQIAQLWVTALLQGRVEQVVAVSDVPFVWDEREVVKTAEELKTKIEGVIKTKGVRNLQAGEATFLKDAEVAQAADRFNMLDVAGLAFVLVKIDTEGVLLAIKSGNQLKVGGFSD